MIYNEVQLPQQTPVITPTTTQMNFIFRARMLSRDLATWLKLYMVSLFNGVGDTEALSQQLFRLPMEYGNVFKIFFGDQSTEQFINIITQYIANLQSLFIAQRNNDVDSINKYTQQVYLITNNMASFLAGINPFWTQSEWSALLNAFTNMQIEEATTFLTKQYKENIDIFNRILSLTNIMGDYFSEGVTNLFLLQQQQHAI